MKPRFVVAIMIVAFAFTAAGWWVRGWLDTDACLDHGGRWRLLRGDLLEANQFCKAQKVWKELNPKRLELELMLNPSEKDHLLYLIQHFSAWREPPTVPQDAKILLESIAAEKLEPGVASECQPAARGVDRTDPTDPELSVQWGKIVKTTDRAELASYILRLSHVVLKREWERVNIPGNPVRHVLYSH